MLVTLFDGEPVPEALRLAAELRAAGMRVEVYPEPDKLGKQIKYAAGEDIPFAAILGGDERARGEVTIKNLADGRAGVRAAARRVVGAVLQAHRIAVLPTWKRGCHETQTLMQIEPLGKLARTHTCGALRAEDVGTGRRAARLGAPGARPRVAGLHRCPRPLRA